MPEGFNRVPLGDIAEISMGQSPDSRYVEEGSERGVPFLQGNAEFGDCHPSPKYSCSQPAKTAREGDVLVSVRAPVGEVNLAERSYCIGRGLSAVRFRSVKSSLGQKLIAHFGTALNRVAQGTTFAAIGRNELSSMLLLLPPASEQPIITHILDTLDTQIRRTEEVIAKLEQIKQGLLTNLLTRGIDENGGLRPSPEEAPGLYKNSPVGRIPREWDLRTVVDEFQIQAGFTLGAHRIPNAYPCPYLRVGNVFRGRLELDDIAYLEARPAELSNRALRQGDLLVVEGHANPNEIGRCAMVTEEADGFTFQNHLFRLRPLNLTANFALLWMNSEYIQSYWRANCATSSGLYTINRTKLGAVPVIVPSKKEQVRIGSLMEQFEWRRSSERNKLDKLWTLRQGLTDDLLTGRVRVTPLLEEAEQAAV